MSVKNGASSAATAPAPASTISVFSQLPPDLTETILQVVTGISDVVENSPYRPWRIKNRYYETTVYFHILKSLNSVAKNVQAGSPAVLVLLDSSKDADLEFLSQLDVDSIDIPLVAGKATQPNANGQDIADECFANGWEYVDLEESGQDEAGGQTGYARLSEALQAHMWPILNDGEADSSSTKAPEPSDQPSSSKTQLAFDDDFSPFISSSNSTPHSSKDYPTPEEWEEELSLADLDAGLGDDAQDPTARLANMFASLADLKNQAMSLPEGDRRKDFAAEIAMKFAKQLDSLIDDDDESSGLTKN